jgi:hypothetical protein
VKEISSGPQNDPQPPAPGRTASHVSYLSK